MIESLVLQYPRTTLKIYNHLNCQHALLLYKNYLALQQRLLTSEVLYADETHWRVMGKGTSKKWWVWILTDRKRSFFMIQPGRGKPAARLLLQDYDGIVMAARHSAYVHLAKERTLHGDHQLRLHLEGKRKEPLPSPDFTLVACPTFFQQACWKTFAVSSLCSSIGSHARRGFIQLAKQGNTRLSEILNLIGELYQVENEAKESVSQSQDPTEYQQALLSARKSLRENKSHKLIETLKEILDRMVRIKGLALDKAINYALNAWTDLTRFLEDHRIPLDNGLAEQQLRGVVLGRKNYGGSRSSDRTILLG